MSWDRQVTIYCDADDCEAEALSVHHGNQGIQTTRRKIAKESGWSYTLEGGDRCPNHRIETCYDRYEQASRPKDTSHDDELAHA